MSARRRFEGVLRWYPTAWRQRYGDELVALLEDTYGDRALPFRCRLSLVRAGTLERLRGTGLERDTDQSRQRVRSGSLVVLCSWMVFVVAGAGFAKFTEHWDAVTPRAARGLPTGAYEAVRAGALAGALLVLVAASASLPAFVRSMRQGGLAPIRRPVLRAAVVTSLTALATVVIVTWAHHLGPRLRNGGSHAYLGAGTLWVLLIVASIGCCAAAAVAAARHLRFSARVLRLHGVLALAMTVAMVVVTAGTLVWWGAVATDAPWFFGSGVIGSAASPVPPAMVVAGILMVLGLVGGLVGAGRVVRSLPGVPRD
jgi:hypothetical protein